MKTTPTAAECEQLWEQYHTPANVREHMRLVRDIAVWTGRELVAMRGEVIDLQLVQAGALLHDFVRFVGMTQINLNYFSTAPSAEDFQVWRALGLKYPDSNHAQAAGLELRELGYSEALARVVERHDYAKIIDPAGGPQTREEQLVFYADKRVVHRTIVTLAERFADGEVRYPEYAGRADEQLKRAAIYELERELFSGLAIDPDLLGDTIQGPQVVN